MRKDFESSHVYTSRTHELRVIKTGLSGEWLQPLPSLVMAKKRGRSRPPPCREKNGVAREITASTKRM